MRTPLIAGNWKMNTVLGGAIELATELQRLTEQVRDVEVALIPPFVFLEPVARRLSESRIHIGAQDCYPEASGAFTGAVSAQMLASVGCHFVLCGHSERRHIFGDEDGTIQRKVRSVLDAGMTPILCVGETQEERQGGRTLDVITHQLKQGLDGVSAEDVGAMVIAYEPVWAIGTGDTATPGQAQDVHAAIREWVEAHRSAGAAHAVRIQYGGSVKPENVDELMACADIDGALVGGASLDVASFVRIIKHNR